MKELICPDALISKIGASEKYMFSKADIIKIIQGQQKLPAVPCDADTVAVIRCRDCKWYDAVTDTEGGCTLTYSLALPHDYCSYAMRRGSDG